MQESSKVLEMIYSLRENERTDGFFSPVVETRKYIWSFKIKEFDKLGVLVMHLEVKAKGAPSLTLEKQIEVTETQLTYLEEDLRIVEHDRNNRMIIFRSNLPHKTENTINYYEIVLKEGKQLSFDRYEFDKTTGKRAPRPANLSRATFERLLADFESLLA